LRAGLVPSAYDCVLIDTPGAIGPLQDAAVMAADVLVSPITPEILSAREFRDGTMELLARLEPGSALGAPLAPVKAVIYRQDRTADARLIVAGIAREFAQPQDHPQPRVSLLQTVVPHAKAYKEAATLRIPVHQHERRREGTMPSAWSVMHGLAWELMPSLRGVLADGRRVQGVSS
jgi:chromosome partitioning related protein ParA